MIPSISGSLLMLGFVLYVLHKLAKARNHSTVGYAFLDHARSIFLDNEHVHEVEMLNDLAIPHVLEIRKLLAHRIFWTFAGVLAVGLQLVYSFIDVSSMIVNVGAMTAVIASATFSIQTNTSLSEVDEICDACDEDLVSINRPDEYQVMLDKYLKDPSNDS